MSSLLLIEDDEALSLGMEFTLKDEGYQVERAETVEEGRKLFLTKKYDLIILDINLPDGSGYDLCKFIRSQSSVPVLFLTALDDEVNIVLGLEIGGDEYITKPFRVKEFLSRIKVLIRRNSQTVSSAARLKSGDIEVDISTATVKKNGSYIAFTAQEYKLLLIFMFRPKTLLKRDEILNELIEQPEVFFDENTLSVYIKRIREKIEENPKDPEYIVTQRGMGYKWDKDVLKIGENLS